MSKMTFFYADGRVERMAVAPYDGGGLPQTVDVAEPTLEQKCFDPRGRAPCVIYTERRFRLHVFDRHLRVVRSKARWEVYIEDGRPRILSDVLMGAHAAQALGRFIGGLGT